MYMRRKAVFLFMLPVFFSCCVIAETLQVPVPIIEGDSAPSKMETLHLIEQSSSPSLVLTFAGDLMAHTVNYNQYLMQIPDYLPYNLYGRFHLDGIYH